MAPVVLELRKFADVVDTVFVSSGQHREMLTQALSAFDLSPDFDLEIMQPGQTLAGVTSRALEKLDKLYEEQAPDMVIGQGDTTTCFVAALAAFYRRIPFAHVEAGLRTETIDNPFPEEFNRRVAGLITKLHFPPTSGAAENLRRENVPQSAIHITGNTGIDAVLKIAATQGPEADLAGKRLVLLTTHRRENWGEPQRAIARAALRLVLAHPDIVLWVPMHRNPVVRDVLQAELQHERIKLMEPPDYADFIHLMKQATLILTDSGGVQEEAPSLGIPVLILRETTERPEGVYAGVSKLVGTDEEAIFTEGDRLLSDPASYQSMAKASNPFGDGMASARIRHHVLNHFGIASPPVAPLKEG